MYGCEDSFENDTVYGYSGVKTCACTYCDTTCPIPQVDGVVLFFDGCDWSLVATIYVYLMAASLVIQIIRYYQRTKLAEEEKAEAWK